MDSGRSVGMLHPRTHYSVFVPDTLYCSWSVCFWECANYRAGFCAKFLSISMASSSLSSLLHGLVYRVMVLDAEWVKEFVAQGQEEQLIPHGQRRRSSSLNLFSISCFKVRFHLTIDSVFVLVAAVMRKLSSLHVVNRKTTVNSTKSIIIRTGINTEYVIN